MLDCSLVTCFRHGMLVACWAILAIGLDEANASELSTGTMDPVAFVEMPLLESPVLSHNGKQLLLIRSTVDWQANKRIDRYQIIDTRTLQIDELPVWNGEDQSLSPGIWAPDSSGFITLLEREGDNKRAAYFYDLKTTELNRMLTHDENIRDVVWKPDGSALYYRSRRHDPRPKHEKSLEIAKYDVSAPNELWQYDLSTNARQALIAGEYSVSGYDLSADGSLILHGREPEDPQLDSHHRELWLYDVRTGDSEQLTTNAYRESNAKLSPDGLRFAYIATVNDKGEGYYEDNLFVQERGASDPRLLIPDEAMEVLDYAWNASSQSIFILGNIGVRTELFSLNLETGKIARLTNGDHEISDWHHDAKTGMHSALITDAKSPGDAYVKPDRETPFVKVTSEYDLWNGRMTLSEQSAFRWTGRDGQALEGILALPVEREAGQALPLVTITHGGPRTSSQFGNWRPSRYLPVLTGLGYAVFLPNHRGSTGYGDAFMRDMVGNYFNNAHLDILDGIDALIAQGIADPDRLIKMGWSAGGHMTNKMITYTDRFKAASSGAGASEWMSMYAESDVRHNRTPWFGGAPWQEDAPIDNFTAQSPLKDSWRVSTPTLFFNGAKDVRVPPTQAIMMYRGVRATGTPTHLYLAPGEPHGFKKPIHQLFKINAELEWFARHALGKDYQPVLPSVTMRPPRNDEHEEEVNSAR